jgi:hypothetical protein
VRRANSVEVEDEETELLIEALLGRSMNEEDVQPREFDYSLLEILNLIVVTTVATFYLS